ncbi:MAG: DUF692 domain-containing protein [Candidatus Nitrotoga sp.]|nr:DUF692 domain-containing protein [Candidatus Nitrotoga sp.]MDO9448133.1 DUF692 domain-containing protein [Candidatus Nitrotoga sp.]MDP1636806.1 DUF692 domain-containing protein [Candidatus Nitrotoga sp.]MDP1855905.1 DUF692 domain-containing protein [Candidatus Nitrotoga sp.]MDP3498512.1 DUF692 domain-containing protein [Candidatus Nitrotoga sp.]
MGKPASDSLPCTAGIGLRAPHYCEVLEKLPKLGWVEVHNENFFGGGASLHTLLKVRNHYPVSLHGVGMGLASTAPLDQAHLSALYRLCDAVQPAAVSEHLCWNSLPDMTINGSTAINDLLPFPYTQEALFHVARRVDQVQEKLGRRLLVENLSSYLSFTHSEMSEGEFLSELSQRTGCAILFDINNLYVNARNLGVDAKAFIQILPAKAVAEYHLAGHSIRDGCLVDTHSTQVCAEVWKLYDFALQHIGPRPTLIEWDSDIPVLAVLKGEAEKAQQRLEEYHAFVK